MQVARLKSERNLTELIDRIFDLDRSSVSKRELRDAIAEANPDLDLKRGSLTARLDPGELIAVPEIEGAVTTRATHPVSREVARLLLRESAAALKRLPEAVTADADAARAERDAATAALGSSAFKRAIRDDPRAKERVKEIKAAAEARAKLAHGRVDTAEEAIVEAMKVIERMLQRMP
jgi:hypothetical protein